MTPPNKVSSVNTARKVRPLYRVSVLDPTTIQLTFGPGEEATFMATETPSSGVLFRRDGQWYVEV